MKKELQRKLLDLYSSGYKVKIYGHPYVDGFATIYSDGEDNILYDSQVFSEVDLTEIQSHHVEVFKPIDNWETVNFSEL